MATMVGTELTIWPWPPADPEVVETVLAAIGEVTDPPDLDKLAAEGHSWAMDNAMWTLDRHWLTFQGQANYGTAAFDDEPDSVTDALKEAGLNFTLRDDGDVEWDAHVIEYRAATGTRLEYPEHSGAIALTAHDFGEMVKAAGDDAAELGRRVTAYFGQVRSADAWYVADVQAEGLALIDEPITNEQYFAGGKRRVPVGDDGVEVCYGHASAVTVVVRAADALDAERRIIATWGDTVDVDEVSLSADQSGASS